MSSSFRHCSSKTNETRSVLFLSQGPLHFFPDTFTAISLSFDLLKSIIKTDFVELTDYCYVKLHENVLRQHSASTCS